MALQKEIADVQGLSKLVSHMLKFDPSDVNERAFKKFAMKTKWILMIEEHYKRTV